MFFPRRLALALAVAACALPAGEAAAAVRVFPGCGATLAACIASSPAGTTIRLRTNALVPIPNSLEIKKAVSLVAAPGFRPQVGRTGTLARIEIRPAGSKSRTVAIRGIHFRQVSISVQLSSGTGHRIVVADNRIENDTGANGDSGLFVGYSGTSRGSLVVRNNRISSPGVGIMAAARGRPATIVGNRITTSDNAESQAGINLFGAGSGTVRATIASNVVDGVAGCNCGFPSGIYATAFDSVRLDLRILGNTLHAVGLDAMHQGYAIVIVDPPSSSPTARIDARLYNNLITDAKSYGILLYNDDQVDVVGDRNAVWGAPNGNILGPYDLGTILTGDPLYVNAAAGNYRLGPGSPYANAGQTCIPSLPLPRGDAAQRFRVAGPRVDVGAFERGSNLKAGVPGKNLSGTNAKNTIVGTKGRDVLCGLGGPDRIVGRGGADLIFGGSGNDLLRGGAGADRIFGEEGADKAYGGQGRDRIDVRDAVSGNDLAHGGPGRDTCFTDTGDRRKSCP